MADFKVLFILSMLIYSIKGQGCSWCATGTRSNNPRGQATSNGCGSGWQGAVINPAVTPRTRQCCNAHDLCYNNCFKTKGQCDNEFDNCLRNICNQYKNEGICIRGIMTYFVQKFGCSAFQTAQAQNCICTARG